jgi:excisionase family DNA binding protein
MQPQFESGFTETFSRELAATQNEFGDCAHWDMLFLAFLRAAAPFGHFRVGPISIDLGVIEETIRRRGVPFENNMTPFSRALMREVRESGRKRVDALHYLMVFMKHAEGLPRDVFGELGVTPEQVERALREPPSAGAADTLLTPEEVADYLKVHVETVRGWIRSGRLPASRVAGLRALRIRQSDATALLQPLESPARGGAQSTGESPDP